MKPFCALQNNSIIFYANKLEIIVIPVDKIKHPKDEKYPHFHCILPWSSNQDDSYLTFIQSDEELYSNCKATNEYIITTHVYYLLKWITDNEINTIRNICYCKHVLGLSEKKRCESFLKLKTRKDMDAFFEKEKIKYNEKILQY